MFALAAAATLAAGLCLYEIDRSRSLRSVHSRIWRIGFHQTAPFISQGSDGQPAGFGKDVLTEAAQRGGISLQWVYVPQGATAAFEANLIDLWPRSSDVPGFKRAPYISESWFESFYGIVLKGQAGSSPPQNFSGKRVVTGPTPFARMFASKHLHGAIVIPRANWGAAVRNVCSGEAEAAFAELREAMSSISSNSELCRDQRIQLWPIHEATVEAGIGSTLRARLAADILREEIGVMAAAGLLSEMHARWYMATPNEVTSVSQISGLKRRQSALLSLSGILLAAIVLTAIIAWKMRLLRLAALRAGEEAVTAQQALEVAKERYDLAVSGSNDGIWDWDLLKDQLYYSPRWKEILGFPGMCDSIDDWFARVHADDLTRFQEELNTFIAVGPELFEIEYRLRHADETWRWVCTSGAAVRDKTGRALRIAGSVSDITPGKLADPLCGLPNRLAVVDRLERLVERYKAAPNRGFALLFLDIDRFKLVNDSLGHRAGDELLLVVSRRLFTAVRSLEGTSNCVGRLGGDEFVVILDDLSGPEVAQRIALRILDELKAPCHVAGNVVFTSVSIGISFSGMAGDHAEDILQKGDAAMYHAKREGRGRYAVFDVSMHTRAVEKLQLETDLRNAIEHEEFLLHYQPQVCLRTGNLTGFEALVRWQRGARLASPLEFISVAEETGSIIPLGRLVIERACRQMSKWRELYGLESLTMSVNLSCRQLVDPDLVSLISQTLSATGLPASCLRLEMTESVLADDPASVRRVLGQLSELGVGLEIDDFGTGYSSLSQLHQLPFKTLKVDRSFVQALDNKKEGAGIVHSITSLAGTLGISVIAEGVETEAHWSKLEEIGCHIGQGYFFGAPADAVETTRLIEYRRLFPWRKPPITEGFTNSLAALNAGSFSRVTIAKDPERR